MINLRRFLITAGVALWSMTAVAQPADYSWTSESRNSSESMPLGGGDIGLNVWAEGGDLCFYICRSGSYDEHNALLKAGRVRLRVGEGGDPTAPFRQTLRLSKSAMVFVIKQLLWRSI